MKIERINQSMIKVNGITHTIDTVYGDHERNVGRLLRLSGKRTLQRDLQPRLYTREKGSICT